MNNHLKKIFSFGKQFRLTSIEKNSLRMHIARYMHTHPKGIPSPFVFRYAMATAFALILVTLSGGTLTFASLGSLPGDTLYGVKRASESIQKIALVRPEQKAAYELTLIEKRFDEVNQLVDREIFTAQTESITTTAIKNHVYRIEELSEELESTEPAEALMINTRLANTLKTRTSILITLSDRDTPSGVKTNPKTLVLAAYESADRITKEQKNLETLLLTDTNSATIKIAEKKYTAILALAEKQIPVISPEPELAIATIIADPAPESINEPMLATTMLALPVDDAVAVSKMAIPEPEPKSELEILVEEIKDAYARKQYGQVIILSEKIEELITRAEKINQAEKTYNITVIETKEITAPTPETVLKPVPEMVELEPIKEMIQ